MVLVSSDFLNVVFILIAAISALILPFELFLFSYAFLGPIHYLTEINWLNSRKFFAKSKLPIYLIISATLALSLLYFTNYFQLSPSFLSKQRLASMATYAILLSFVFVLFTELLSEKLTISKYPQIFIFFMSLLLTVILLRKNYQVHLVTFVFLPTLIHVFLFTFFFMWFGYLKKPNSLGLLSLVLMLIIPLAIAFLPFEIFNFNTSTAAIDTYSNSGFQTLNRVLYSIFDSSITTETNFYETIKGIKIQSFIAFAYTYHYLNWFAKINIVGWAKSISKINLLVILCLWGLAVGLYIYNFKIGLLALFFMSLGHVLLEFPLNIKVMKGILSHYHIKFKAYWG